MKFSERLGITEVKALIQLDDMDMDLRNGIWNVFHMMFVIPITNEATVSIKASSYSSWVDMFWFNFLKEPMDLVKFSKTEVVLDLRNRFFSWKWFKIYEFMEFTVLNNFGKGEILIHLYNQVLERECSGYRFVDNTLAPITTREELVEIQEAIIETSNSYEIGVNTHLKKALLKLSDKKNPDYRNSIKESISALESLLRVISKDEKAELGKALKIIKSKLEIHPALEKGFLSIYGYTSDGDGIRHALMDKDEVGFEDAKYMLVACSSFINYLKVKAAKAEIKLK